MEWVIDLDSERPPSRQLVETVLDGLASGELSAGEQLPSVRGLASEAMVNHNTVARAWRDLEQLGVAKGRNGRGVFITPEGPAIAENARSEATLAKFRRAAFEAIRAGHDKSELARLLLEVQKRKTA